MDKHFVILAPVIGLGIFMDVQIVFTLVFTFTAHSMLEINLHANR